MKVFQDDSPVGIGEGRGSEVGSNRGGAVYSNERNFIDELNDSIFNIYLYL